MKPVQCERIMATSAFHVPNLTYFLKFSLYIRSNSPLILVTLYCMQPTHCLCRNWCLYQCTCNNWRKWPHKDLKNSIFPVWCSNDFTPKLGCDWCHTFHQSETCKQRNWRVRFGAREVTGSIPGRDIPKSLKMVLAAPRLALRLTG